MAMSFQAFYLTHRLQKLYQRFKICAGQSLMNKLWRHNSSRQSMRYFSMSTNVTPTYPQTPSKPIFSPGSNVDEMKEALEELLDEANRGGNWRLTSDKMGLQRSFKFKGFNRCWVRIWQSVHCSTDLLALLL